MHPKDCQRAPGASQRLRVKSTSVAKKLLGTKGIASSDKGIAARSID